MRVAVLTISDTVSNGERVDLSGPAVVQRCRELGWEVTSSLKCSDDPGQIRSHLRQLADSRHVELILTTGGTGLGPRDNTPGSHAGNRGENHSRPRRRDAPQGLRADSHGCPFARRRRCAPSRSDPQSPRQPQRRRRIPRRPRHPSPPRHPRPPRRPPRLSRTVGILL